ncbi:MAG: MerR family transcriptional regulator [Spirochaetota bacterium]
MKDKYTISELASDLDISTSAIRFYEDKGLISPERTPGNQRFYTKKERARLKLILRGKRFGASLNEIAEMIGLADSEINEIDQIKKSLFYLEKKEEEIKTHMREIMIFEEDLLALKNKLLKRKSEIINKNKGGKRDV